MFLLYGATGYTGTLIAEECARRKIPVTLAGRSDGARVLADRLALPFVVVGLDDAAGLDGALAGKSCVLHCAGPFSRTSKPMVEACLRNHTHYLDITGELPIFERLAAKSSAAKDAGIMLLPGSGFDVVPSDCLAAHMKRRMPDAVSLKLCISSLGGSLSHGTALTMVEHFHTGGAVRKNGAIVAEPAAKRTHTFDLGDGKTRTGVSMPWGDISTAWHSTHIPDIEVYFSLPKSMRTALRLAPLVAPLLQMASVKRFVQSRIPAGGPDEKAREAGKSMFVGEVSDHAGNTLVSRLTAPEGYKLTALTALACVERVTQGDAPVGFQTPSTAYGADFILAIAGTARIDVV